MTQSINTPEGWNARIGKPDGTKPRFCHECGRDITTEPCAKICPSNSPGSPAPDPPILVCKPCFRKRKRDGGKKAYKGGGRA